LVLRDDAEARGMPEQGIALRQLEVWIFGPAVISATLFVAALVVALVQIC
jgi:hypothetical protein